MPNIPLLPAHAWETSYRHEQGDLVNLFYVPALSCAVQYDRMTGYFTADALALAARGIEKLIANGGRMRLLVGCTLGPDEVQAIEQGYDLKQKVEDHLLQEALIPPKPAAKNGLEALAWMIGHDLMEIKVAIPTGPDGKPIISIGIYHEKVGIIADSEGNRISFSGSINETRGGWINNRESFHVHCSWETGREWKHVNDEVEAFDRFWEGDPTSVRVFDFPDAVKQKLLEFLPTDDRFVSPPVKVQVQETTDVTKKDEPNVVTELVDERPRLLPDELRRLVWTYLRYAARMENGVRVGEATSAIQPWPHQVRAFKRLIDEWPCQMLIADEVGLGKTITAGLLIRQAWISELAKRILLLVPKAVMRQWQEELYEKFNLNVPLYDGQKLIWKKTHGWLGPSERKVERDKWHLEPFVIASSHLMRRRDRAKDLLQAENWDLLVADEAHHARRKSPGSPQEGGPNNLLRLLHELRPKCRSLLLLTATPMQVHPVELWDLLKLLGLPKRWADSKDAFLRYFTTAGGNPNQAEMEFLTGMFRDMEAEYGAVTQEDVVKIAGGQSRLSCRKILKALQDDSGIPLKRLTVEQRKAALQVLRRFSPIRHRMSRHTRSLLREYHKRGLIDTPIATRNVQDIPVLMTGSERELYDAVEDYISTTYDNAAPEKRSAVGFVMTIYRRRLASSFFALQSTLNKRLAAMHSGQFEVADEDVSQNEQRDEVMDTDEAEELSQEALMAEERGTIQGLLKLIAKVGANTKAKRLATELQSAWADGYDSAIIFTQYTDTMDWLRDYLAEQMPQEPLACFSGRGGEVRDLSGQWQSCAKDQIKQRLREGKIKVLLCTDAAAEGLNFQVCGMLVNYDLPWNPMKVEQRIGRIDRIGQKHPIIRIINLAYEDTVEADIYFALGQRINLFQGLVGRLQPILSRLPKQFEDVVLTKKGSREAARERLLADFDLAATHEDAGGLDIDEVAKEALEMLVLPTPSLTLDDIERVMNRDDLRPSQVEWKVLDVGTYAFSMPGLPTPIRVTTRAAVFDDHFESHEFLGPGNQMYERLVADSTDGPDPSGPERSDMATGDLAVAPVQWTIASDSPKVIQSLEELLNTASLHPAGVKLVSPLGEIFHASADSLLG
jgi:SNF2 family DNA or RNA helicase